MTKKLNNRELNNKILKPLNNSDFCEVSRASAEIMLDRFCNGKEIDFPFSKIL